MSPETMIRMANQIADFWRSQPQDPAEHVAEHMKDYWEPRMRDQLLTYISQGGEGLDPIVTEAARHL